MRNLLIIATLLLILSISSAVTVTGDFTDPDTNSLGAYFENDLGTLNSASTSTVVTQILWGRATSATRNAIFEIAEGYTVRSISAFISKDQGGSNKRGTFTFGKYDQTGFTEVLWQAGPSIPDDGTTVYLDEYQGTGYSKEFDQSGIISTSSTDAGIYAIQWFVPAKGLGGSSVGYGDNDFSITLERSVFYFTASTSIGGSVSEAGTFDITEATEITLTATADNGYIFGYWSYDQSDELIYDNPLTLTVENDGNITAVFLQDTTDVDGDELSKYQEVIVHGTDPLDADSDDDGFSDGFEVDMGFSPLTSESSPDAVSELLTAAEFRFNAANGVSYRIETSSDLENWSTVEEEVIGSGGQVTRFYSIEGNHKRFYRPKRND
jgi:hypothetical protein